MAKRRSTREQVLTLLTERTQKQVAKMLGVSERTIRRWKNEGTTPLSSHASTLSRVVRDEYAEIRRKQKSFRIIHRKTGKAIRRPVPFVNLPIQIIGTRRVYNDIFTGAPYLSDNVFYDVSRLTEAEIVRTLERLRDSNKYGGFNLVGTVPQGGTSPGGRDFLKGGRFGTQPESFFHSQGSIRTEDLYDHVANTTRHNANGYVRRVEMIVAYPSRRVVKQRQRVVAKRHEAHEKAQIKKEQERKKKKALKATKK